MTKVYYKSKSHKILRIINFFILRCKVPKQTKMDHRKKKKKNAQLILQNTDRNQTIYFQS